jgi:hypothetical protein
MQLLAIIFFVLAAIAFSWDLFRWGGKGGLDLSDVGTAWYALHPTSLQLAQPAVQRYLAPELWDSAVQPLLLTPAALLFGALGVLFTLLHFMRRRRRSRSRFS